MGIRRLNFLQLGDETVKGTEVNATVVWRGRAMISDDLDIIFPPEEIALIPASTRSYIPKKLGAILMEETPLTFEQLPYILDAGVDNDSPSVDSGASASDYIYEYIFPTTVAKSPKSYTLESQDDQQEEQMTYSMVKSFTISGRPWEACMMSAVWFGRAPGTGSKTGALTSPAVDEGMFQNTKVYIDAGGGTIGDTQITNTVREFALSVNTGIVPIPTADDRLDYTLDGMTEPVLTLRLKMLHNATAVAEKAAMRAETTRLIRILIEGPALGTGATYSKKTVIIDVAGLWQKPPGLTDDEGQNVVDMSLNVLYSLADTLFAEITVVNELSALV